MIYEGVQYNSWKFYPTNIIIQQVADRNKDNRQLLAEYLNLQVETIYQYISGGKRVPKEHILALGKICQDKKYKKFKNIYKGIGEKELNVMCNIYETERRYDECYEYDYNCQMTHHRLEKEGVIHDYIESWVGYE